ncbi:hypothetical protein HYH03_006413 [Edaphochlamys debaryana]|uniref:SET domain-containing protein n=1 Tax=Edaphochlamys debaryana TaxID=47281 RepID=A0A835Y3W9_9CHLO|nr:hypothetical protein HYH03_006413 [Edaphochlamys debaryana]|eukprot:KAG2495468.1 hypothetical protein HYH03_006413 [Edaphochlamys debaryana]
MASRGPAGDAADQPPKEKPGPNGAAPVGLPPCISREQRTQRFLSTLGLAQPSTTPTTSAPSAADGDADDTAIHGDAPTARKEASGVVLAQTARRARTHQGPTAQPSSAPQPIATSSGDANGAVAEGPGCTPMEGHENASAAPSVSEDRNPDSHEAAEGANGVAAEDVNGAGGGAEGSADAAGTADGTASDSDGASEGDADVDGTDDADADVGGNDDLSSVYDAAAALDLLAAAAAAAGRGGGSRHGGGRGGGGGGGPQPPPDSDDESWAPSSDDDGYGSDGVRQKPSAARRSRSAAAAGPGPPPAFPEALDAGREAADHGGARISDSAPRRMRTSGSKASSTWACLPVTDAGLRHGVFTLPKPLVEGALKEQVLGRDQSLLTIVVLDEPRNPGRRLQVVVRPHPRQRGKLSDPTSGKGIHSTQYRFSGLVKWLLERGATEGWKVLLSALPNGMPGLGASLLRPQDPLPPGLAPMVSSTSTAAPPRPPAPPALAANAIAALRAGLGAAAGGAQNVAAAVAAAALSALLPSAPPTVVAAAAQAALQAQAARQAQATIQAHAAAANAAATSAAAAAAAAPPHADGSLPHAPVDVRLSAYFVALTQFQAETLFGQSASEAQKAENVTYRLQVTLVVPKPGRGGGEVEHQAKVVANRGAWRMWFKRDTLANLGVSSKGSDVYLRLLRDGPNRLRVTVQSVTRFVEGARPPPARERASESSGSEEAGAGAGVGEGEGAESEGAEAAEAEAEAGSAGQEGAAAAARADPMDTEDGGHHVSTATAAAADGGAGPSAGPGPGPGSGSGSDLGDDADVDMDALRSGAAALAGLSLPPSHSNGGPEVAATGAGAFDGGGGGGGGGAVAASPPAGASPGLGLGLGPGSARGPSPSPSPSPGPVWRAAGGDADVAESGERVFELTVTEAAVRTQVFTMPLSLVKGMLKSQVFKQDNTPISLVALSVPGHRTGEIVVLTVRRCCRPGGSEQYRFTVPWLRERGAQLGDRLVLTVLPGSRLGLSLLSPKDGPTAGPKPPEPAAAAAGVTVTVEPFNLPPLQSTGASIPDSRGGAGGLRQLIPTVAPQPVGPSGIPVVVPTLMPRAAPPPRPVVTTAAAAAPPAAAAAAARAPAAAAAAAAGPSSSTLAAVAAAAVAIAGGSVTGTPAADILRHLLQQRHNAEAAAAIAAVTALTSAAATAVRPVPGPAAGAAAGVAVKRAAETGPGEAGLIGGAKRARLPEPPPPAAALPLGAGGAGAAGQALGWDESNAATLCDEDARLGLISLPRATLAPPRGVFSALFGGPSPHSGNMVLVVAGGGAGGGEVRRFPVPPDLAFLPDLVRLPATRALRVLEARAGDVLVFRPCPAPAPGLPGARVPAFFVSALRPHEAAVLRAPAGLAAGVGAGVAAGAVGQAQGQVGGVVVKPEPEAGVVGARGVVGGGNEQLLPAPSLSAAHLQGCALSRDAVRPPALQPGELRLCGLTFHPELAPGVRSAMEAWEAGLAGQLAAEGLDGGLADAAPEERQITVLDSSALRTAGVAEFIVTSELAELLGLALDWGTALPQDAPQLPAIVEPRRDEGRGGVGLFATARIPRGKVVGSMAGYVLPRVVARKLANNGFRFLNEEARAELTARAAAAVSAAPGAAPSGEVLLRYAWQLLEGALRLPMPGSSDGWELSMLGYGSLAALINDPRREPRGWVEGNDVGDEGGAAAAAANCAVVPVSVRGLTLPVVVALRDIQPGEQLLRDYGADWWTAFKGAWGMAEHRGLTAQAVLHPRGALEGLTGGTAAAAPVKQEH